MSQPHPHLLQDLERTRPALRRLAMHLLRDESAAEDAVQEAALRALKSPPPSRGNSAGWLRVVTQNAALQRLRARRRRRERERRAARPARAGSAQSNLERVEQQRQLWAAVEALGEPDRQLIVDRYVEGLSSAQLAARHGLSRSTVDRQLCRARDTLRSKLDLRRRKVRTCFVAAWGLPRGATSWGASAPVVAAGALAVGALATAALLAHEPSVEDRQVESLPRGGLESRTLQPRPPTLLGQGDGHASAPPPVKPALPPNDAGDLTPETMQDWLARINGGRDATRTLRLSKRTHGPGRCGLPRHPDCHLRAH